MILLLATEQPRAEANVAATELLKLAIRMRREQGWSRAERAKALVALCQKVTLASQNAARDTPHGLQALRAIIREQVSRAGLWTTINQTPPFDAAALRDIVAGEVRADVTAAGRDRWSTERLSTSIEKFLEARYPVDNGKSRVGSKHRGDIESRLVAFLGFSEKKNGFFSLLARPMKSVSGQESADHRLHVILDAVSRRWRQRAFVHDPVLAYLAPARLDRRVVDVRRPGTNDVARTDSVQLVLRTAGPERIGHGVEATANINAEAKAQRSNCVTGCRFIVLVPAGHRILICRSIQLVSKAPASPRQENSWRHPHC